MARSFAPCLSILIPLLFLSPGSALVLPLLGLSVGTMAHPVGKEKFAPSLSTPALTNEYEVFVSFHAEDTRKSFTSHLFAALDHKGIHVYGSDLCLDELVKIMECKRVLNQSVLPIFYHVSPSDVREWKGNFAEALLNGPEDKLNNWKAALRDATNLAG